VWRSHREFTWTSVRSAASTKEVKVRKLCALVGIAGAIAGCGSSGPKRAAQNPGKVTPGATQLVSHAGGGHPRAVRFVAAVTNPWFPLEPGTTLAYRGVKDGKPSRDVFTVEHAKQAIDGVRCTVVNDVLYLSGKLEERTTDWYAQDAAGNVWYFGERTAELDASGRVKSTAGTWRAGVNGAQAGIYLPGNPRVGQSGRQEYYRGQAEDHYRVKSLSTRVTTPGASSARALLTEEWTPLEPGVLDHKYYVRGVGTALEQTVKGGDERNTLISVRHR
jgi:hypothetical protein